MKAMAKDKLAIVNAKKRILKAMELTAKGSVPSIPIKKTTIAPTPTVPIKKRPPQLRDKKGKRVPTKEQKAKWRSLSKAKRDAYLAKHPKSMFKDVFVVDKLVTRATKLGKDAKAVMAPVVEAAKSLGFKASKLTSENIKKLHSTVSAYATNPEIRKKIIDTSQDLLTKLHKNLSHSDREEVDRDMKDIAKLGGKTRFSKWMQKTGRGAKAASILGVASIAAIGVVAGVGLFISPDAGAYLGIKILDSVLSTGRTVFSADTAAIGIMGYAMRDFHNSKDADEHMEGAAQELLKKSQEEAANLRKEMEDKGMVPTTPKTEVPIITAPKPTGPRQSPWQAFISRMGPIGRAGRVARGRR